MFYLKYFFKIFFWTLAVILFLFGAALGFVALKQESLVNRLIASLEAQSPIPFSYSGLNFSITQHFPFASLVLHNFVVNYAESADTLLFTERLVLSVDVLGLMRGEYFFNHLGLSNGCVHLRQPGLQQQMDRLKQAAAIQSQPEEPGRVLRLDRLQFNNFGVEVIASAQAKPLSFSISKARVSLDAGPSRLQLQFRSTINGLLPAKTSGHTPLELQAAISKSGDSLQLNAITARYQNLKLSANGRYRQKEKLAYFVFSTNRLNLKQLAQLFDFDRIGGGLIIDGGTVRLAGDVAFDPSGLGVKHLNLNHSASNVRLMLDSARLEVPRLVGNTRFEDDFKVQRSTISHIVVNKGDSKLSGTLKLKGMEHLALLFDGDVELSNCEVPSSKPVLHGLNFAGHAKLLANLHLQAKARSFELLGLRTTSTITVDDIALVPDLKQVIAKVEIDNSAQVSIQGQLDGNPLQLEFTLADFDKTLKQKKITNFTSSITSNYIDIDKLLKINLLDSVTSTKTLYNYRYQLDFKLDSARYLNKRFNQLDASILLQPKLVLIDRLRTHMYGGTIQGRARLQANQVTLNGNMQNIDITSLFADNNSFGQTFITQQNISGNLKSNFTSTFTLTNGRLNADSLHLLADFQIEKGKLLGMSKVKQLDKWLNLRAVESIDFSNLHNKILLNRGVLQIPLMHIKSNVLNVSLDGQHTLGGDFEYHARLNLQQLLAARFLNKSSAADFERDDGNNLHLNLLITGNPSAYQVKLDRKRRKQHIQTAIKAENELFKDLVKQEFGLKRDSLKSAPNKQKPSEASQDDGFRIEWDDD